MPASCSLDDRINIRVSIFSTIFQERDCVKMRQHTKQDRCQSIPFAIESIFNPFMIRHMGVNSVIANSFLEIDNIG